MSSPAAASFKVIPKILERQQYFQTTARETYRKLPGDAVVNGVYYALATVGAVISIGAMAELITGAGKQE
eukprot:CAMPEP_0196657246 /NCGR_PEP_ID=MMETSP1086-20130531/22530_1 /TAXON_ID=77921 /ORGANISM="Cyanoptyche  gloeocystis , Strain SAG4.97" /LENGTH=69 /DNA_ID=CAMNT_0041990301 /DNA_START=43 /DNA_END=252 /DNA_ORIENTATION=-